MPLVLTIVRQPEGLNLPETRMLFNESGGTLGRAADNNWSLPDPSRFVSSHHASIRYDAGDYYLVDTSTNGVFVNTGTSPLGTGNQVRLQTGDKLYLGEYEIHVEYEQSENVASMSSDDFDQWLGPESTDTGGAAEDGGLDLLTPEQELLDPLAALDKATGGSQDQWDGPSLADNSSVPEQAFVAPNPIPEAQSIPAAVSPSADAAGVIPDDWDIDDLLSDKPAAAAPAPIPEQPSEPAPTPIPESSPFPENLSSDLDALLDDPGEGIVTPQPDVAKDESDELDAFLGLDDLGGEDEFSFESEPTPVPAAPEPPAPLPDITEDSFLDLGGPNDLAGEIPPPPEPAAVPEPPSLPISPEPTSVPAPSVPESLIDNNASQPAVPAAAPAVPGQTCDDLIRSLGLDPDRMTADTRQHFQRVLADTLRETVGGMMQVLGARNAIKNEFRMNVTMIQPMENNPLKFSPNADEALRNMFTSQSNAYLPGTVAIKEGFQDVADHQVAVIAGMRAAFRSLLKRFDPSELQVRFDKQHQAGFLASKKGKYWEAYGEFYSDLADNMDDAFQDLFGEDFAEAYEQQMGRLEAARKK